ncbi:MAG: MFS transporter [Candidatus Odinarchaeota archaeon]
MTARFDKNLIQLLKLVRYNSLGFFFVSFIIPIVAFLEFKANGYEMGLLFSLQVLGATISAPVVGMIADKRDRRPKLIFTGSLGRMVAYLVIYFSIIVKSYWLMVFGTFSLGFAAGFFWSPLRAIVSDATEYRFRSEAFGIYNQQIGMGTFYGAFIGFGILMMASEASLGSGGLFAGLLVYALANLYAGIKILRIAPAVTLVDIDREKAGINELVSFKTVKTTRLRKNVFLFFIVLLGILFVESTVGALVAPFLEVFLLKNITNDPVTMSLAYIPGGIVSMVAAPKLGEIADRIKPAYVLPPASIIGAITTWLLINSTEIWQVTVLFTVDSTVIAFATVVISKLMSNVSKNHRGSVFGFQGFLANLGGITGPLVGGVFWEITGDRGPFLLSIGVEAVLALIYLVVLLFFLYEPVEEKRQKKVEPSSKT